ncbi:MAG: MFS transporter [Clostridia bacterium]|nr:MFS transporter [Clostridia bacterium]
MATLLLILIYIVFIGLGLPDSLFGSAWPAIYPEFNLPVSAANAVTILISSGTVLASFFSARLINKFGTGAVTAVSTVITALSLLGFSFAQSIWWFIPLTIPLGAGAGAIDAALNNYVAVHYNSTQMNFLHCFYGVGVALSPFLMSFALEQNNDWRLGYRTVFYIMIAISIVAILCLPLWNKVKADEKKEDDFTPKTLTFLEMAKMPAVRTAWITFFSSVALEFTCGVWGCTYLVSSEGMSEALAAFFLTFYYIGMTLGRFTSGVISKFLKPVNIIYSGYSFVAVGLTLLVLPVPPIMKGVALLLIGFGNAPTFPNLTYLTPINFGKDISQSIIGTQMAFCNIGILLMPPVFGFMADLISVKVFPYYLIALFAVLVLTTLLYFKLIKKMKNKENCP